VDGVRDVVGVEALDAGEALHGLLAIAALQRRADGVPGLFFPNGPAICAPAMILRSSGFGGSSSDRNGNMATDLS
jgi:hypothetical protein